MSEEEMPSIYYGLEIFIGVILCCVLITAVVGNTLTFIVVTKINGWRNSAIMFIAHLAVVDILNSTIITPFSATVLFQGRLSNVYITDEDNYATGYQRVCDITGFMFTLVRVLVPLTNVNIAVDRTLAVTLPLKYNKIMNPASVVFILITEWAIALTFASAPIFINRHIASGKYVSTQYFEYNPYLCICHPLLINDDHYFLLETSLAISTVIIPFIVVFVLSMVVIRIIVSRDPGNVRSKDKHKNGNEVDAKRAKRSLRTRKATHTLLIVVALFMLFWLPYCLLWLYDYAWEMRGISPTSQMYLVTLATLFIMMNSATNPLIFISRSEKYRSVISKSAGSLKQRIVTYKEEFSASAVQENACTIQRDNHLKPAKEDQELESEYQTENSGRADTFL